MKIPQLHEARAESCDLTVPWLSLVPYHLWTLLLVMYSGHPSFLRWWKGNKRTPRSSDLAFSNWEDLFFCDGCNWHTPDMLHWAHSMNSCGTGNPRCGASSNGVHRRLIQEPDPSLRRSKPQEKDSRIMGQILHPDLSQWSKSRAWQSLNSN